MSGHVGEQQCEACSCCMAQSDRMELTDSAKVPSSCVVNRTCAVLGSGHSGDLAIGSDCTAAVTAYVSGCSRHDQAWLSAAWYLTIKVHGRSQLQHCELSCSAQHEVVKHECG
jgi:hypothetical protein